MNFQSDYNKFPLELELNWSGFRARAADLMRCGWDIEAVHDPARFSSCLLLRNSQLNLEGMSSDISVVQWTQMVDPRMNGRGLRYDEGQEIRIQIGSNARVPSYRLTPQIASTSTPIELGQYITPDEFISIINVIGRNDKPDEIVIEKRPDVVELLNQIKDLQEPRAKELLAKERKRGRVESFETSANVIALRA